MDIKDIEATRRQLKAKREAAGRDTPIGWRCKNLMDLLDNWRDSAGDHRTRLEKNIRDQMAELAELTKGE